MTRLWIPLVAIAMLLAACGSTGGVETTLPAPEPVPTIGATSVTTTLPPATPPPAATTAPPDETTTTTPATGAPGFAISQVTFGSLPFVVIRNNGPGSGSTVGLWLCQQPGYFELPDVVLEPGERLFVGIDNEPTAVGASATADAGQALGELRRASGEIGLYYALGARPDFGDPAAIVDYVEWGDPAHGRSTVAVEAGIWPQDGFVEVTTDTLALTVLVADADAPEEWAAEIGG